MRNRLPANPTDEQLRDELRWLRSVIRATTTEIDRLSMKASGRPADSPRPRLPKPKSFDTMTSLELAAEHARLEATSSQQTAVLDDLVFRLFGDHLPTREELEEAARNPTSMTDIVSEVVEEYSRAG